MSRPPSEKSENNTNLRGKKFIAANEPDSDRTVGDFLRLPIKQFQSMSFACEHQALLRKDMKQDLTVIELKHKTFTARYALC